VVDSSTADMRLPITQSVAAASVILVSAPGTFDAPQSPLAYNSHVSRRWYCLAERLILGRPHACGSAFCHARPATHMVGRSVFWPHSEGWKALGRCCAGDRSSLARPSRSSISFGYHRHGRSSSVS
jgi:hypothetical protein